MVILVLSEIQEVHEDGSRAVISLGHNWIMHGNQHIGYHTINVS